MATFELLWKNYPSPYIMKTLCVNKQATSQSPFGNYCAINLSEYFIRSGISLDGARGKMCWSHSGSKHLLLAQDFADWLQVTPLPGFSRSEVIRPAEFQSLLSGRTGVVFFQDYWQRGGENVNNRSGDHIDLWNENEITSSPMWWRSVLEFFEAVSDLNASKKILFWELSGRNA